MPSVAEQLRRAREQQKLTVSQVADATNIRSDHIRALEEGNYDVFAAPVYIRGFTRTYGALLKLDVRSLVRDLDVELGQSAKFQDSPGVARKPLTMVDRVMLAVSKVNWRVWLVVVGAIALIAAIVLGYRAWRSYMAADPLEKLGPGMYQPKQTNTGETLPLPKK